MEQDVLLEVDRVSKKYCRSLKRSLWYGARDIASEVLASNRSTQALRRDEFWAVNDVSFSLRRGECVGLIGHNGAGKTSLLKMLNGLIKPDRGRIRIAGRVGALIALGAGFNPILSGRENIYVNGAVLGMTKREIDAQLDDIIDFAELREFIDAPVQSYSSGMAVRLGFAVATAVEPDVLLLDEVLAVGDTSFRHKCYSRVSRLLSHAAVILVSHTMEYIGHLCSRVVLMRDGTARHFADPAAGIAAYLEEAGERPQPAQSAVTAYYPPIQAVTIDLPNASIDYGGRLIFEVDLQSAAAVPNVRFSFTATNDAEQTVFCWHSTRAGREFDIRPGRQRLRVSISPILLHEGVYRWGFNASPSGTIEHIVWFVKAGEFRVTSRFRPIGKIPYLAQAESCDLSMVDAPTT